jgi:hypothetical protein
MLGVHEKNLPQFVYTDQINYTNHVRLFILSVFCISLLDYVLFGFFYSFSANIFTTWISICLSILFCFYCICHFSIKHYSSVRFAHKTNIAFQIICFFTGLLLGISTIIINYFLIKDVPNLSGSHILTLTALLLTSSHIIA